MATLTLEYAEGCPIHLKEEGYLMATCLWGLAQYLHLCKCAGRFFTDDECFKLDHASHTFLYMYSELRRLSEECQSHMWNIVPKFHQFQHIILDIVADKSNPRCFHCFRDKDMVGKMFILARSGHPSVAVESAMDVYLINLVRRVWQHATSQ